MMKKPILVTGSHRSGSTWVGKMIAASGDVFYVHEPFNIAQRSSSPFRRWYSYVGDESDSKYQRTVNRYVSNLINPTVCGFVSGLSRVRQLWELKQYLKAWPSRLSCRPLVKDPIAVMSVEWLWKTFNMDAIVVIRSPLAFAASCKGPGWQFDVNEFLDQPLLMQKYLAPLREELETASAQPQNHLMQICLCWKCIYQVVNQYREQHDINGMFVRHEDLALSPLSEFEIIFGRLGLPFTADVREFIKGKTEGRIEGAVNRVSASLVCAWREKLTDEEIRFVRKVTDPVASLFYSPDELSGSFVSTV